MSANGAAEPVPRDMADRLPPSMQGEVTAASLVNGQSGAEQEHDGQTISAEDAAQKLQDSADRGAVVHQFNENDSPQQKKAQAMQAIGVKMPKRIAERHEGGTEVATDMGGMDVKPSISLADVNTASEQERGRPDSSATGQPAMPGGLPTAVAAAIPDWYKIGWRANAQAFLESGGDIELARQNSLLAEFLNESYYGGWYHDAAIIFFAVFASHYVTVFGGGFGWLFIILAICSTYYQTSSKRGRHRARDDISRELAKQRLFTDSESVDWMNNFLSRFWLIYESVLSATIVASVDQTLSSVAPAGIDSMRMTHFTLGTKAPRLDFIRTHPNTEEDVVVMDMKLSFTPNDTADLTTRQAADKVNPKVVLTIKFGKGKVVLSKDLVVEDVTFAGVMRIRLKLMHNFPHVQTVDLSFLEKPIIDFVAKPIGFDINMIPGLDNFIDNQIHANLGPMLYAPNTFTLNLEQLLSSAPIDTAIGVLQVTVYNARGLKGVKFGGGLPDPYVSLGIGKRSGLAKTKIRHSTANPRWNETKFLLVNTLSDVLTFDLYDYNDHRKDSDLGLASFDLQTLNDDPEQEDLVSEVLLQGKSRGTVKFDLKFFPVLKAEKAADGSDTEELLPESNTGIVRITLHQAKELDMGRSGGSCNPYAKIYLRGRAIYKTPTFKRNHSPMWESSTEFLVTSKDDAVVGVKVIDSKGFASDPTLGYVNVKLKDILAANAREQDWFPLSGAPSGKIRMSANFRPVAMAGAINSSRDFRPPIGVVRIWMKRASDLKNVEGLTGGKSDAYVRVIRKGVVQARTLVHNNNLNPDFDEIVYVPVQNLNDVLMMEVMDYEHTSKDRSLGITRLKVEDVATKGNESSDQPYVSTGTIERAANLTVDHAGKIGKGTLYYEAIFYPTIPIKGVVFDKPDNSVEQMKARVQDEEDNQSYIEPTDDEGNDTPAGQEDRLAQQMKADAAIGKTTRVASGTGTNGQSTGTATPSALGRRQNGQSTASLATNETSGTVATKNTEGAASNNGIAMTREQILSYQSGVLVFNIISGNLARKGARLEVAFDDAYWPNYSTEVARSTHQTWDEVGESFIRELGYSRIILRLNEADKESRENIQADFRSSLSEFLEQCLDKPADFMLTDQNGGSRSTVTISAKYVPVPIQLEMRETVNNTGIIRVDVLDGHGLKAADRNGKSDPFCEFYLNDEKVFSTQIQKRTLNPKWNEHFEMLVPSRVAARCRVKVLDWDRLGKSDKLGSGMLDVVNLEPFQPTQQTVQLHTSDGAQHGSVNVRMVFRPEFVARSRAATSTFVGTVAGGAMGGVGNVVGGGANIFGKGGRLAAGGVGAVAGGVGTVGKGVFSGVRHIGPGSGRRNTSSTVHDNAGDGYTFQDSTTLPKDSPTLPKDSPTLPKDGHPLEVPMHTTASDVNGRIAYAPVGGGTPDFGQLEIQVTDIQGVPQDEKVRVQLHHGSKHHEKAHVVKNATTGHNDVVFNLKTLPEAMVLTFSLVVKKSFGKDRTLGSAEVDVWSLIHPGSRNSADTTLTTGAGDISMSLTWTANAGSAGNAVLAASRSASIGSHLGGPDSPTSAKSKSRFSMTRKRESTPGN